MSNDFTQGDSLMSSAINWFEIPARDFERAADFYDTILGTKTRREVFSDVPNAILRYDQGGVGGAIIHAPQMQPTQNGVLVYLNAWGNLDGVLKRVEAAGGKVIMPKQSIGPMGFIAVFEDTEGNHVGLHEPVTE